MKLDKIVAGQVYVDANVFYMYLRPDPDHFSALRTFLERGVVTPAATAR
jgi:predicted nucleic acid-binding protein